MFLYYVENVLWNCWNTVVDSLRSGDTCANVSYQKLTDMSNTVSVLFALRHSLIANAPTTPISCLEMFSISTTVLW